MSNQPTSRMLICNLAVPPDAITPNAPLIATVEAPPFRLLQIPPLTSELYDRAFADFAMSNLGVSIAANASNQTRPEGK